MASLNKAILIGHLTADPELKQTGSGLPVCSFRIGVSRRFAKEGDAQKSDFIDIVTWRQQAEFVSKYFKKGSAICVCGAIQTRTWTDQQGNKRYATEVVADEVSFVERKSDGGSGNSFPALGANGLSNAPANAPFEPLPDDEDLPF